jgi:hypothetical protein
MNLNWKDIKEKVKKTFNEDKAIAIKLEKNVKRAAEDLESGKVFHDDEAAENLKNSVIDMAKIAGMAGIFVLPGGAAGLVAIRQMLKSREAEKLGIKNLLTLTDLSTEEVKK